MLHAHTHWSWRAEGSRAAVFCVLMLCLRRRLRIPDKSADWQIWAVASQTSPDAAVAMGRIVRWVEKVLAERTQLGLEIRLLLGWLISIDDPRSSRVSYPVV